MTDRIILAFDVEYGGTGRRNCNNRVCCYRLDCGLPASLYRPVRFAGLDFDQFANVHPVKYPSAVRNLSSTSLGASFGRDWIAACASTTEYPREVNAARTSLS